MKFLKIFYYVVTGLMILGGIVNFADGVFDVYQLIALLGYGAGVILIENKE